MWRQSNKQGVRLTGEDHGEIQRRLAAGETFVAAAKAVGCSTKSIQRFLAQARLLKRKPTVRSPRRLSCGEREELSRELLVGRSLRKIAVLLGRAPSTISREVKANGDRSKYRAWSAEHTAATRNRRPRLTKFESNPRLRLEVERGLTERWSPQQIAARLLCDYPGDRNMHISHETIYRSLFIQARGALRKELTTYLRTRRTHRQPHGRTDLKGRMLDMVMISERPPEAADRSIPGHWEGDLIIGKGNHSAIGTLVERRSRYLMLVHLPRGRSANEVRKALTREVLRMPAELRRTLTWDQGKEMAEHLRFTVDAKVNVFFCDPHSPWQRGSNENTNGLLRQYFPKGTDLSIYTRSDLEAVARQINSRPRQTLGWMKPCEVLRKAVASTD